MINQKALVIGASGLVGRQLIKNIKDITDTYATYNTTRFDSEGIKFYQLDVRDAYRVDELLKKIQPNIVIDLAAKRNTRYCEKNPSEAYEVNVGGTKNIVNACKDIGAKMVFISSDLVFGGTKGNYNESDDLNPLNVYGRQKAMCEQIIKRELNNWLVIRTGYIYGFLPRRDNFISWLLENFEKERQLRIITDQFTTFINAKNFVSILIKLLNMNKEGIYHIGEECLSKYEFAERIKRIFKFNVVITPVLSKSLNIDVVRPKNNCLDLGKMKRELGVEYSIESGLRLLKEEYDDNR